MPRFPRHQRSCAHCSRLVSWLRAHRYTLSRSLATSSIAGWLVGLGERSPHHILLDQTTAEVTHVGMQAILLQRPAVDGALCGGPGVGGSALAAPPFRLTRELTDALGPTGVDGPFRCAAEAALRVAQADGASASLLTILEVSIPLPSPLLPVGLPHLTPTLPTLPLAGLTSHPSASPRRPCTRLSSVRLVPGLCRRADARMVRRLRGHRRAVGTRCCRRQRARGAARCGSCRASRSGAADGRDELRAQRSTAER